MLVNHGRKLTVLGICLVLAAGMGCGSDGAQSDATETLPASSAKSEPDGAARSEGGRQGASDIAPADNQPASDGDLDGAAPLDPGPCDTFDCDPPTFAAGLDDAGAQDAAPDSSQEVAADGGPLDGATPEATAWRWESSLGLELEVPASWAINDYGCGQTDAPTVVRQQGAVLFCDAVGQVAKEVIEISPGGPDSMPLAGLTAQTARIDSDQVQRAEGPNPDGLWYGWLYVPRRNAVISLRVRDPQLAAHVLDSVRIVDLDHHGCTTTHRQTPAPAASSRFVPEDAAQIAVCYFGQDSVLQASGRITGSQVAYLVGLMNAAPGGMNPDDPRDQCLRSGTPPLADAILIVENERERAIVSMTFSGCTDRGLSNGSSRAHLNGALILNAITIPLRIGLTFSGSLAF